MSAIDPTRGRRASRRRGARVGRLDRGSAMAEAALVTPVVFAMIFGIVELGMIFKDYLAAQAMIRAGVRIGAASPRIINFAQLTVDEAQRKGTALDPAAISTLWVYKANAGDDFPIGRSDFADCSTCVKFAWNAATKSFSPISTTWSAIAQNACTPAAGGPPDRIGIYMRFAHPSMTGIVPATMIAESATMSLEPSPALTGCK